MGVVADVDEEGPVAVMVRNCRSFTASERSRGYALHAVEQKFGVSPSHYCSRNYV